MFVAIATAWSIDTAFAADPERALSQFLRDRWERSTGFAGGQVYAITQTRDGYLWIASEQGIVRFDGLRFRLFQPLEPTASTDTAALNVAPDSEGGLWTSLRRAALMRFRNGAFENALRLSGPPDPRVGLIASGNDGAIVIADLRLGLLLARGGRIETILTRDALPRQFVTAIAQSSTGDIWLGTRDAGLIQVHGNRATPIAFGPANQKINCLVPDGRSGLWIGTDEGIFRWSGDGAARAIAAADVGRSRVLAMIRDRDGNVWAGTSDGVIRIDTRGRLSIARQAAVTALFEDREGNLWIGSAGVVERWRDAAFASYAGVDAAAAGAMGPVFSDAADRVWFAPATGGLYWIRDGHVGAVSSLRDDEIYSIAGDGDAILVGRQRGGMTRVRARGDAFVTETFTERDGLAQDQVFAVHRARDGAVWAGTLSRGVSRLKDGTFTTFGTADGLASSTVTAIVDTSDGGVWFATPNGASVRTRDGWRRYSTADGLPANDVNTLFEDSARNLWLGTTAGLAVIRAGAQQALSWDAEALRGSILGVAEDRDGGLWIATTDRVLRVDRERLLQGALAAGDVREFNAADGLVDAESSKRHRLMAVDPRGRLWVSTRGGLVMADTHRVAAGLAPALVHIEDVAADGSVVERTSTITIPPRRSRITFTFAALSLSIPDRVRFRYRLDGFDRDWSEPTAERQAVFTNLGPGSYRFRVTASNSDGVWNSAEAALPFNIAPAWWQMASFWAAAAILLSAGIWAAHRLRVRIVEKHEREISALNERLMKAQEQERIRLAGELHDGVMQEMLAVTMMLGSAKRRIPDDVDAKAKIDQVQDRLIKVGTDIRRLSHDLHPPILQEAGLPQAIRSYCEEFSASCGLPIACEADERARELSRGSALALYRIVQEALGNAAKHAAATRIRVRLDRTGPTVSLAVSDDGVGFDRSRFDGGGGLGLVMMRERASQLNGTFEVESAPGRGTTVSIVIPFR